MDAVEFLPYLGVKPKKDAAFAAFLDKHQLGRPKGGFAGNKALGIELAFCDGGLSAVFLYGRPSGKTKPFQGRLPKGIAFGMTAKEIAKLGDPAVATEGGGGRYDFPDHAMFVDVDDDGVKRVTLQPPIEPPKLELFDVLYFESTPADPPADGKLIAPALLVAWAAHRCGLPPKHAGSKAGKALLARTITPLAFFIDACGRTLESADVDRKLLPWLIDYTTSGCAYDTREGAKQITKLLGLQQGDEVRASYDFLATFKKPVVFDPWFVPGTWEAFDRWAPVLDARWADFQATAWEGPPPAGIYERAAKERDAHPMSIKRGETQPGVVDAKLTDDLLGLVGHALTESAVKAVLARATLPVGKKIDEQAAPKLGISYMGTKIDVGGKRVLGVDHVNFYADRVKSYIRGLGTEVEFVGYPGELPKGLKFRSTRAEVVKLLGKPVDADPELDGWEWQLEKKTRELRCLFDKKGLLVQVIWGIPHPEYGG